MAGFVFSISKNEGLEGVKKCIKNGTYLSMLPNPDNTRSRIVVASVLADYCSMKEGDNVYLLSNRQVYGVGKLVKVGPDCKYQNYLNAHEFVTKNALENEDKALIEAPASSRWLCLFEPEGQFFEKGVDMDEILLYKPSAFKMLRAFQDVTFIKIDDEENRALKECIYLKNRGRSGIFNFSKEEHLRISEYELEKYLIYPEQTIQGEINESENEVNLEMLLEAYLVDKISKDGLFEEKYDYVSHQVIASPFKPLAYIDKMDIFAYRFLDAYPSEEKPIEKYLVVELKKGKANKELPLQLMRYVDWISKEYASGDYSLIKAVGIAKSYKKGLKDVLKEDCTRSYLSETHPNSTCIWEDIGLYTYNVKDDGVIDLEGYIDFDATEAVKIYIEQTLGLKVTKTTITVNRKIIKPLFKVQEKKWAFFNSIETGSKKLLEANGWRAFTIEDVKDEKDVRLFIGQIIK